MSTFLFIFLSNFGGWNFILPVITGGIAIYCGVRWAKTKFIIPLVLGIFFALATIALIIAMSSNKL